MKAIKNHAYSNALIDLLSNNYKGNICVSLIIPTYRKSPERMQNKAILDRMIKSLQSQFDGNHSAYISEMFDRIYAMADEIDFNHTQDGVGMFVSAGFSKLVYFPFEVHERLIVSDNFHVREVLLIDQFMKEYLVLSVDHKGANLYRAQGDRLDEVLDENFPMQHTDDYEYQTPYPANSFGHGLKSPEKDKSIIEEIRLKTFFKNVDARLKLYSNDHEIVVTGPNKEAALFVNTTLLKQQVSGIVQGNFNYSLSRLAEESWKAILNHRNEKQIEMIRQLDETKSLLLSDLKDIWSSAKEGRGLKLLVEKDYTIPGFLGPDEYKLFLRPPKVNHIVIQDVIDNLIEIVLDKNGTVEFVQNGSLEKFGRVVLLTRY